MTKLLSPLRLLKAHIVNAKQKYGQKLMAVSISSDFHSQIVRTFKDDLIGATINGIEIRIASFQIKRIEDIFFPAGESRNQQKLDLERYAIEYMPFCTSKEYISLFTQKPNGKK